MKYSITLHTEKIIEWGLNLTEAVVFSFCYELPSWADAVSLEGILMFRGNRRKASEEMGLRLEPDTIYRTYKKLHEKGLIVYAKNGGDDLIALTDMGKTWFGKKSDDSEKNPKKLGKKSESHNIVYKDTKIKTPLPPEGENPPPKEKPTKKAGAACAAATEADFSKFANPEAALLIWRKWVDYKKIQKGFTYKDDAAQAAGIYKLFNCSGGSIQKARAVIDDAMANGYTGFFPYKDEMAASAQMPEPTPAPADDFHLADDMQKRYDSTTSWFYKNCPSCTGVRWLSKKEFMSVMNRSEDLIPPMWYTKCPEDDFNSHVTKSISSLNAAPRWEKEKWPSIFEWLRYDLKIRIFGKKDNQ